MPPHPNAHRRGGRRHGSPGSSRPSSRSTSRSSSEPGGRPGPSKCCSCPGSTGASSCPWHPPGSRWPAASPRRAAGPTWRQVPTNLRATAFPPLRRGTASGRAARAGALPAPPLAGRGDKACSLLLHRPWLARLFPLRPGRGIYIKLTGMVNKMPCVGQRDPGAAWEQLGRGTAGLKLGAPARPRRAAGAGRNGGPHPQSPPAPQEPLAAPSALPGHQRSC